MTSFASHSNSSNWLQLLNQSQLGGGQSNYKHWCSSCHGLRTLISIHPAGEKDLKAGPIKSEVLEINVELWQVERYREIWSSPMWHHLEMRKRTVPVLSGEGVTSTGRLGCVVVGLWARDPVDRKQMTFQALHKQSSWVKPKQHITRQSEAQNMASK